ncbi:LPXTG cell wall anchor domain-containing protein [Enterococcus sp. HY326]|uniref:LPXTG cell wall anchor domain-containing protein n=1 Tax=Enterococcus sp. HY326 TaxID=2971265 RepID=UPI0022409ED2|nr:LPXTG cell wall anchor domain-containing protein [Enterococcus sp. HY326]
MKKQKWVFLLILGVVVGLFWGQTTSLATNTGNGQVTVEGGITFYEESSTSSSSSDSSSSESVTTTSSSQLPITGGGGKLPNTGEVVRNMSFLGAGLLLLFVLFVWYRRKKGGTQDEK